MCGIIGYIGKKEALSVLVQGLRRLQYRGYDSVGVVVFDRNNQLQLVKTKGKIDVLERKLKKKPIEGNIGLGHCLPPDVLIQLADGRIKPISELKQGEKVLCLNPKTLKIVVGTAKIFRHKPSGELFEVRTNSTLLQATGRHKLLVFSSGEIKEKEVKDLKKGDLLIFPKKIKIKGKKLKFPKGETRRYYQIPPSIIFPLKHFLKENNITLKKVANLTGIKPSYLQHILAGDRKCREDQVKKLIKVFPFVQEKLIPQNTSWGKFISLPSKSSSKLMQIIGYFLGDGTAQPKYLRFKDTDRDLLQEYKKLFVKIFNVKGRVVPQKNTSVYLLEINSTYLSKWFKKHFVANKNKFLEEIGKAPKTEIAFFLRGLFDAEGCVAQKSGQLSFRVTDKRLAQTVQFLLLRFGILSSFRKVLKKPKHWSTAWEISISSWENIKKFRQEIGFTSKIKQQKLNKLLEELSKRQLNFIFKFFPFTKREIRRIYFFGKCKLKEVRGSDKDYLMKKTLEIILKKIKKNKNYLKFNQDIQKFLEGEVVFQPIQSIKKIKIQENYLYDLEVSPYPNFIANCIFSHNSRWATHGKPSEINAHPHFDCKKEIFVVHNGIIENYLHLKEKLEREGHKFVSETDTEVLPHLIEKYFKGNLEEAVRLALKEVVGAYAIAVISSKDPQKIVFARQSSPLLVGLGEGENFIASDAPAILGHTRKVIYLDDGEMGVITPNDFRIFNLDHKPVNKTSYYLEWNVQQAEKGGYPHFMLKEIMEEPEVIENAIRGRMVINEGLAKLGGIEQVEDKLKTAERLIIVGMGTALLAGKVGEYMLEEYAQIPVEVENASEFRYKKPVLKKKDVLLAISQSGETADTLFAVKEAKRKGILTLGVINVIGSSIAREVDAGVYNHAGPEIGVAATKSFISQLAILALLTVYLGRQREMSLVMGKRILEELIEIPDLVRKVLDQNEEIKKLAEKYYQYNNFLFLGRKYNYPIALEGALKLKEISYIHAEGYPAGEMKHGPIAMIDENFPSVIIAPKDSVYEKMLSNIEEIKARKGKVLAITTEGNEEIARLVDDYFYIPKTLEMLTPILSVIPLQLFAYYMTVLKELDPDKPRNLAKSVTVE
jgi:glucosamine--fructose-6-phosphate aminotransferase (isomerizing)